MSSIPGPCMILFERRSGGEPYDEHGCIKPAGHNDAHMFIMADGQECTWQDDYSCTCGCWEEDDGRPCVIYHIDSTKLNHQ